MVACAFETGRGYGLSLDQIEAWLTAPVDIKIVQEMLGHSTSAFTRDVYTSVVPEIATAAAEAVAAIVPRKATAR